MLLHKLFYLFLLGSFYLFTIMYPDQLGFLLFLLLLFFPLLLFLSLHFMARKLQFLLNCKEIISKEGQKSDQSLNENQPTYTVTIANASWFPLAYAHIQLTIKNHFTDSIRNQELRLSAPSKGSISYDETFPPLEPGFYEVSFEKIRIFSPFSLFSQKCRSMQTTQMICLPPLCPVDIPIIPSYHHDTEGTQYSKTHPGDDPSEVFSLREFRAGDSMRQIHWKLSTKMDVLMVRENSLPLSAAITVFLSLVSDNKDIAENASIETLNNLEQSLSLALSISLNLLETEHSLYLIWYQTEQQEFAIRQAETTEDCYCIFYEILRHPLPKSLPDLSPELLTSSYLKIVNMPSASFSLENCYEE